MYVIQNSFRHKFTYTYVYVHFRSTLNIDWYNFHTEYKSDTSKMSLLQMIWYLIDKQINNESL